LLLAASNDWQALVNPFSCKDHIQDSQVAADEHRASAKKNSNTSTEELPKGKLGLFSAKHSKEIYLVYGMSILMDREI